MTEEERFRMEGFERKKRVRAAHCGSVTRIISQLKDALNSADASKLKQLKQSLINKSNNVLGRLDDELIEGVDEEQLETEVEQADLITEKINLAIISIEEALEGLVIQGTRRSTRRHRAEASPSTSAESSGEDEGRSFLSHHSSSALDDHTAPMDTRQTSDSHTVSSAFDMSPLSDTAPITTTSPLPPFSHSSSLLGTLPSPSMPP